METWNRSVGWYSFDQDRVTFRKLVMNSGTRPVLVHLEEPQSAKLREKPEERDEDFFKFIKETLGTDLYSQHPDERGGVRPGMGGEIRQTSVFPET